MLPQHPDPVRTAFSGEAPSLAPASSAPATHRSATARSIDNRVRRMSGRSFRPQYYARTSTGVNSENIWDASATCEIGR